MQFMSATRFLTGLKNQTLGRPALRQQAELTESVQNIIQTIQARGEAALFEYRLLWENNDSKTLGYATRELASSVDKATQIAIDQAYDNIFAFHQPQYPSPFEIETTAGIRCAQQWRAIQSVGLYIPGGSAPLISTLLMLGIPAQIARCPEVVVCSPALPSPAIAYAAQRCGIEFIYQFGGAQAIAAMAYGTESIPKVNKLFGPGNAFVTEAKRQVSMEPGGAAIDMPAGPSEIMVVADATANPETVAADLLSQAEHGADSQVIFISLDDALSQAVQTQLQSQLQALPRADIALESIRNSYLIQADSAETALSIVNAYAPEHLILNVRKPRAWLNRVQCAGSVFLGPWTPESLGDYASGTNHVLPTYGYAASYSGLKTTDFMKSMSVQEANIKGLNTLANTLIQLASIEGLEAHANAVKVRLALLAVENQEVSNV